MREKYYRISGSEDGDVSISEYTREELLIEINEEIEDNEKEPIFRKDLLEKDLMLWGDSSLIIKGQIVVPEPTVTVKEFKL